MKNYKAGIYLRLSKEDNNINNSIEAQREITTQYAKKNSFDIVKEYIDNGYSGILDSRPALNEMISDILHKKINMVLVKDLSRLTRDKNKTGYYIEIFFPDNDIRFVSVNDYIDSGERYEIDDSIMFRGIINQSYLTDVSRKIKSVIDNMKKEGLYVQHYAPYGYKKSETEKHKLLIDEKVAENVRLIFKMYVEGFSQDKIAKKLTAMGVDTPKKYKGLKVAINEWRNDSISRILRDPTYIGALIINKYKSDYLTNKIIKTNKDEWKIIKNTHEPIIDKELFDRVQVLLNNNFHKPKKKYEYLLKDLVYCGHCGYKMQYKCIKRTKNHDKAVKNREKIWYYKCRTIYKFPNICNKGHTINEKDLNEIVIYSLNNKLQKLQLEKESNKIKYEYKKKNLKYSSLLKFKSLKQKIENHIKILYSKKLDQNISVEQFKEEYKVLKLKENKIVNKIKELEKENKNILSDKNISKIIEELKKAENFDNEMMKKLISKIEIFEDKKVNIIFNF